MVKAWKECIHAQGCSMYEKSMTTACPNKMKSESKMCVSETIKGKHVYNSSEMKSVLQAHVEEKL